MEQRQSTETTVQAQADLFLGRLPAKPYCTDDLLRGLQIRPARTARQRRLIQVNPPWARSFLVFDVDRNDAASAWYDAHLPEPWWNSLNPLNGHGHTCWALDAPVLLHGHGVHEAPMRYLVAVEAALRAAIDGDEAYGGLVTKNPEHPYWNTLRGGRPTSLTEIADWLPDLNKHKPRGRSPRQIGLGRNVDCFDACRHYAYPSIRGWWEAGYVLWQAHLVHWCQDHTGSSHRCPLDDREVYHIGRSVARWTWRHMTPTRFSSRQAALGKRGGAAKGAAVRAENAERDAQIVARVTAGDTTSAVAREFGLARGTIYRIVQRGVPA